MNIQTEVDVLGLKKLLSGHPLHKTFWDLQKNLTSSKGKPYSKSTFWIKITLFLFI